jgi:hypothetical protein
MSAVIVRIDISETMLECIDQLLNLCMVQSKFGEAPDLVMKVSLLGLRSCVNCIVLHVREY